MSKWQLLLKQAKIFINKLDWPIFLIARFYALVFKLFFIPVQLQDQITLLKSTWPDIFLMNLAQFCPPLPVPSGNALRPGLSTRHSTLESRDAPGTIGASSKHRSVHSKSASPCEVDCKRLQDNVNRIKALHMDAVEYSCMKMLLLFNPGMRTGLGYYLFCFCNV